MNVNKLGYLAHCAFIAGRQIDNETAPLIYFALDINVTVMIFNNAINNRQAQAAAAFAHHFLGIEGFENASEVLNIDAYAGVAYRENDKSAAFYIVIAAIEFLNLAAFSF